MIGSSVWLTKSVEPHSTVVLEKPKLRIRAENAAETFDGVMAEMKRQKLRADVTPVRGYTERVERGLNAYIVHSDGTIFQFLTGPKGRCNFYRIDGV